MEPITFSVSGVPDDEFTIEFWSYVYSYGSGTFTSFEVLWNGIGRVLILDESGSLRARCYPYADINNLGAYTDFRSEVMTYGQWIYITCSANRYTGQFGINNETFVNYQKPLPIDTLPITTTLTIRDNTSTLTNNYGIIFCRELKLWRSSNFPFYDTSRMFLFNQHFDCKQLF